MLLSFITSTIEIPLTGVWQWYLVLTKRYLKQELWSKMVRFAGKIGQIVSQTF